MSYILDALKKVEQKREREASSRTLSFSSAGSLAPKRWALWPYLLVAVLAVNAVFLVAWFTSHRSSVKEIPAAADRKETEPHVLHPPAPEKASPPGAVARVPLKPARPVDRLAPVPRAALPVVPSPKSDEKLKPANRTTGQENRVLPVNPVPDDQPRKSAALDPQPVREATKERNTALSGKVYALNELPGDVRQALPDFKISGHAYSEDTVTRVVRINEKILQEGQDLMPGLRLEEIVPDGVVMKYDGFRFRVGLGSGR